MTKKLRTDWFMFVIAASLALFGALMVYSASAMMSMKESNESKFYTLLACFCKYRGAKIIDNLVDIFTRKFHKIQNLQICEFNKLKSLLQIK